MLKWMLLLLTLTTSVFASGGGGVEGLTWSWVGIAALITFVVGYYFIATEEIYHLNKAKPALFIGTFM
ncbi:MAG TPA: sodium:proton antiporter, partial [Campylobacterales bacterium]|nr:sodium:proton antiporter [Campylobacterales bacterium]